MRIMRRKQSLPAVIRGCIVTVLGCLFLSVMVAQANDRSGTHPAANIAHRGFSLVAPENTLASTRKAIEIGADWCECDVARTVDGALVVMHDSTVDRTTNGRGEVAKLTLAEIKRLDAGSWKGGGFAKERVPTLAEYLAVLKNTHCKALIEIKPRGLASDVVKVIRDLQMVDQAAVISFHGEEVKEVRALEPRLPCGLLLDSPKEWSSLNTALRADWIAARARKWEATFVDVDSTMLTARLVAELRQRKILVWTWTVDDAKMLRIFASWGVGGITTNRPDILREVLTTKHASP